MATVAAPSSTAPARRRWSSGASGVVRNPLSVPMTTQGIPAVPSTSASMWVVVVLPLVPVTPMTSRRVEGSPWTADATGPRLRRTSATTSRGTSAAPPASESASGSSSTINATAPAATASPVKRCPSTCSPRTQANRSPGDTARLSSVTLSTSTVASPTSRADGSPVRATSTRPDNLTVSSVAARSWLGAPPPLWPAPGCRVRWRAPVPRHSSPPGTSWRPPSSPPQAVRR